MEKLKLFSLSDTSGYQEKLEEALVCNFTGLIMCRIRTVSLQEQNKFLFHVLTRNFIMKCKTTSELSTGVYQICISNILIKFNIEYICFKYII